MTIAALRAIVIIIIVTVAGLIILNVFIPGDNTALTVQIVGIVAPTTAALLAFLNSAKNSEQIQEAKSELVTNTLVTQHTAEVAQAAVELGAANNDALAAHSEKLAVIAGDVDGKLSQLMDANVEKARLIGRQEGTREERDRSGRK